MTDDDSGKNENDVLNRINVKEICKGKADFKDNKVMSRRVISDF